MRGAFAHFLVLCLSLALCTSCQLQQAVFGSGPGYVNSKINDIPFDTRAHWMRRAIRALADLSSPCPVSAFGTVIVNHTAQNGVGEEVCIGVNAIDSTGNPSLHGEMAAISNCSEIFRDANGRYKFTAGEALHAFKHLSLYTTAEACPMCASAIRWAGFREYIFGTSLETLIDEHWSQIRIDSRYVLDNSQDLGPATRLVPDILHNETDIYFGWQFNDHGHCPPGCVRKARGQCKIE